LLILILHHLTCSLISEVIRHESYSSNADVYSFGVCLWQLITREIPFATMTPLQAAYAVGHGLRPEIPPSTPIRLEEIIRSCWDQDSHKRPSFTYIALALADYAKLAFSPANVGTRTLEIANEMLATVEGNSTVNVDFSAPVNHDFMNRSDSFNNIGLDIESTS
jgi:serine/threonine protein kinase